MSVAAHVSVVIPTRDNPAMLAELLGGLRDGADGAEVIVVDNGSRDPGVPRAIAAAGARTVHVEAPFNFSLLANAGAAAATRELVLLLNDDIETGPPGWLEAMAAELSPRTGPVGAVLCHPHGTVQHAGIVLAGGRPETVGTGVYPEVLDRDPPPAPDAVTAACMLIPRDLFAALGGFETLLRTNYNDVDLCLRSARAGRAAVVAAGARLIHHESATRGRESSPEVRADWLLFRTRWAHLLGDGAPSGASVAAYPNEGRAN